MTLSRYLFFTMTLLMGLSAIPSYSETGLMSVERIHKFGEVGIGFDLYHTFVIVNRADKTLRVDSVHVTCDCSRISFFDSTLAPGDTAVIRLKFNTKDYYGEVSKAILVYSNSPVTPKLDLFYTATVGQWYYGLKPNPISLFFLPRTKAKTIHIVNRQLAGVEISELTNSDSLFTAVIQKGEASRGDTLSVLVTPSKSLSKGTYVGNFRLKLVPKEELDPVFLSIPVKIVKY